MHACNYVVRKKLTAVPAGIRSRDFQPIKFSHSYTLSANVSRAAAVQVCGSQTFVALVLVLVLVKWIYIHIKQLLRDKV